MTTPITHAPKVRWSYMDHWRSQGPAGPIDQWQSRLAMTRFLRQVAAVGGWYVQKVLRPIVEGTG